MENIKDIDSEKKDGRLSVYLKVKQPSENDRLYYNISENKKLFSLHDKIIKNESSKTQKIELDKNFDDSNDEQYIYQEVCQNCIDDCLQRKNFTYISYGDSTSEKNELILGKNKSDNKGIFFLLLNDFHKKLKHIPELMMNLSYMLINSSTLIDLSQLNGKKKYLESINEKNLINKFG